MGDTYYSTDPKSIERVSEMLSDAWKRGMEISQITSQPSMNLPTVEVSSTESVSKVVEKMLKNNASSVLITENGHPAGVISDKEILRNIIEERKDPSKTEAKDLQYTPLVTLNETESVTNALKIMHQRGTARIAVVKNGQLVGMLTEKTIKNAENVVAKTPKKQ